MKPEDAEALRLTGLALKMLDSLHGRATSLEFKEPEILCGNLRRLASHVERLVRENESKDRKIQRAENIPACLRIRLRDEWPAITALLDTYEAQYGKVRHG